jgi:hypothetical protein
MIQSPTRLFRRERVWSAGSAGRAVNSDVADQPVGDGETLLGCVWWPCAASFARVASQGFLDLSTVRTVVVAGLETAWSVW